MAGRAGFGKTLIDTSVLERSPYSWIHIDVIFRLATIHNEKMMAAANSIAHAASEQPHFMKAIGNCHRSSAAD